MELLIVHARVVTLDPTQPRAEAVAIAEGRVLAVGPSAELESLTGPVTRRFDAGGAALLPGIVDPHLHLLAYAASLRSVDLNGARSVIELQTLLRDAAGRLPPGAWLRGTGYDDWSLRERRHPTRQDLDAAVPERPVRIVHRSGHASVLNSLALQIVGVRMDTPEPPGGTIERALPGGEPAGLLLDMEKHLDARIPSLPAQELETGVREASRRLLAWGVTAVEDASPNGVEELRLLAHLAESGVFQPALAAMVDARRLEEMAEGGVAFRHSIGGVAVGEAKVLLSTLSGRLVPSTTEMAGLVRRATAHGFPVSVHAVEAEALRAALDALEGAGGAPSAPHRIEHASVCPPDLLQRLARGGWGVVTQPAFLYLSGDRYRDQVEPAEQPWLYRTTALLRAGVRVVASSDAPVAPPDPRLGLYGAAARRSRSGAPVGADPPLSPAEALPLVTSSAAVLAGWGGERGRVAPGYRADLVLWDRDLTALQDPAELLEARVLATFLGGELAYEG